MALQFSIETSYRWEPRQSDFVGTIRVTLPVEEISEAGKSADRIAVDLHSKEHLLGESMHSFWGSYDEDGNGRYRIKSLFNSELETLKGEVSESVENIKNLIKGIAKDNRNKQSLCDGQGCTVFVSI